MKVQVYVHYERGRKRRREDIANNPIQGLLSLGQVPKKPGGAYFRFAALASIEDSTCIDLMPRLWNPELQGIGSNSFSLRGYQDDDGQACMQVWVCEPIK